jgi:hypothetical protein
MPDKKLEGTFLVLVIEIHDGDLFLLGHILY